jgi:hypothetical protein
MQQQAHMQVCRLELFGAFRACKKWACKKWVLVCVTSCEVGLS